MKILELIKTYIEKINKLKQKNKVYNSTNNNNLYTVIRSKTIKDIYLYREQDSNNLRLPENGWFQHCFNCDTVTSITIHYLVFETDNYIYNIFVYLCNSCNEIYINGMLYGNTITGTKHDNEYYKFQHIIDNIEYHISKSILP